MQLLSVGFQQIFSRFKFPFILQVKTKWLEIISVLESIFSAELIWVTNVEFALSVENSTLQFTTLGINDSQTLVHPLAKCTPFNAVQYQIWDRGVWAGTE